MRRLQRYIRDLCRDRRGVTSVVTAITAVVLVGFLSAAVDYGSVFLKSRQLQGMADLSAMAAASNLTQAQAAADATAKANAWSAPVTATVTPGTYSADATVPAANRFSSGGVSPDAARVTLTSTADLYFSSLFLGRTSLPISRTATAARAQLISFSIGSRLASLNGGIANSLLSGLTGSSVNLSVMDYNALASAQVDLFQYSNALQSRANLTAASFNNTLNSNVTESQALSAIADTLAANGGNSSAVTPMRQLASAANSTSVTTGQLLDLGPYGGQDYINSSSGSGFSVSALDLACAVLQLAQGGRQVQLQLSVTSPGLMSETAWLAIGQRPANSPWITVTESGDVIVRTAQARLYIDTKVAPSALIPGVASIDVPVIVQLASAQAKLSSMTCGTTSASNAATLLVQTSVGQTALGQVNVASLNDFGDALTVSPATMIAVPLVTVKGSSQVNVGGNTWQPVSFNGSDIANSTIKTVQTNDIAAATFSSLLGNLSLNVQIAGFGLGLGQSAISSAVQATLNSVAAPLDSTINGMTSLLGLGLGEADVRVDGIRCNAAALVQ